MDDYWNHNTAYHRWILRIAERQGHREALDVGCGEGLLLQRLAARSVSVTGVEPDAGSIERARRRLAGLSAARLVPGGFEQVTLEEEDYDLITFVASLHHMDMRRALARAARLLRPGGDLLVVGLAANRSPGDWAFSALTLPAARIGSWAHHESRDIGVPVAEPRQNLREIRRTAGEVLPGARIRRGLYYRYLLRWAGPHG